MKIVIVEDSFRAMTLILETLEHISITKTNSSVFEFIALCCGGPILDQEIFEKEKSLLNHKLLQPKFKWSFINSATELETQLNNIFDNDPNFRIAIDVSILDFHGINYAEYDSIKIINKLISLKKINPKHITFYSQNANFPEIRKLIHGDIRTYVRPPIFDPDESQYFYSLITER